MDYAAYQPSHTHPHAYAPPHNGTAGAPVTSPTQQNQVSPIMSQQTHAYSQQPDANTNSHQVMSQMGYSQGYPVTNMHHSYLSASHAAAMATAAASGNYNYSMPDQSMQALAQDPRQSPRMAGQAVKTETRQTPRSPPSQTHMGVTTSLPGQMVMSTAQSLPQSMSQRRMSQISSPAVQSQQSGMSQRRPSMTPQMVQQQQQPQPQPQPAQQHSSPEAPAGNNEESPLYVNAKQFHRILKRRLQRQKLEETLRLTSKGRKPYLHESRHNHAMRRPRGPGGRFLTADEVAAMDAKEGGNGLVELPPSNGVKRKAGDMSGHKPPTPSKRGRMQLAAKTSSSPDDDEDEGDEEG